MNIKGAKEFRCSTWRRTMGLVLAGVGIGILVNAQKSDSAIASGETRTLKFYNTRNNEDLTVTFKRDGRYDRESLKKLNWYMRDWRQNEQKEMDPRLFDILWELYRDLGAQKPIHLVSGYRSPKTNAMLRRRSRGVARRSRHLLGQAADVYFPDVSTKRLREMALVMQRGGVGYYPHSGKYGFVHVDTGSVRHWPRMNPVALAQLFKRRDLLTNRKRSFGAPTRIASLGGAARTPARTRKARLSIASLITRDSATAKAPAPVPWTKPPAVIAMAPRPRAPVIIASLRPAARPAPIPLIKPASIMERRNFAEAPIPLRKPIVTASLPAPLNQAAADARAGRSNLQLARRDGLRKFIAPVATRHAKGDRLDAADAIVTARLDARKFKTRTRRTIVNRAGKGNMLMTFQVRPKPRRSGKSDRSASLANKPIVLTSK